MFDREGEDGKFVSVTVKATDNGDPSLEGVCSFTVEITDINDNPPLFDRQVRSVIFIFNHLGQNNCSCHLKLMSVKIKWFTALVAFMSKEPG